MKFPNEYIRHGKFKLHSGDVSDIFYDVNALLTNDFYLDKILEAVPFSEHYVGIATGGAIIARLISREKNSKFSMIKDRELKGNSPKGEYILIDDVVTTENSLEDAIKIISKKPESIFVVLDRRERNKNIEIYSVLEL